MLGLLMRGLVKKCRNIEGSILHGHWLRLSLEKSESSCRKKGRNEIDDIKARNE